jgi:RNA polymerase sigma-70 factor (ECF subfamily)
MKAEEFKSAVIPLTGKLYRLALRILGDSSDAKDAVQEVFAKLWNMRERLAEVNNTDAFVTTVLRNYCLDRLRTNHSVHWDDFQGRNSLVFPESVEDKFIAEDTGKVIKKMIQKLPEQQREIMVMRDLEGMEYDEIQQVTQTNMNHIRVTLSRARKTVREEMLKLFNYEQYVMETIKQKQ